MHNSSWTSYIVANIYSYPYIASGDHIVGGDDTLASYDIGFSINFEAKFYKHHHSVELMVYKETPHCISSQTPDNTFQLVEVIEKSNNSSLGKVIAVKLVDMCSSKGYVSFDVTKATVRWIEQKLTKLEFTLTVKCISPSQCDSRPEHQVRFSTSRKSMKVPYLFIKTYVTSTDDILSTVQKEHRKHSSKPKKERRKRSSKPWFNYCTNSTQTCCLKKLIVNFQRDLNWNFVRLPSDMYVNYCDGLCPLGSNSTPTHFELLAAVHLSDPCCSGVDYQAVSLLIENGRGNFSTLELPFVTVKSCRCG